MTTGDQSELERVRFLIEELKKSPLVAGVDVVLWDDLIEEDEAYQGQAVVRCD